MTLEQATSILAAIDASTLDRQRADFLAAAVRYARYRTDWALAAHEERLAMDAARTVAHDAFIDACNILSRNMAKAGEDNRWRAMLGDERRAIGDFACLVHALLGIRAR